MNIFLEHVKNMFTLFIPVSQRQCVEIIIHATNDGHQR